MQVTEDGGRTFRNAGERWKHVDNHALWIDPADTRPPGQRQRRRRLRDVRPRPHLGVQGEPAGHAVLPRRGGQLEAVLLRLRRHAGQLLAGRAVAHRHARTASPTTCWFVTATGRRLRQPRRPRGSRTSSTPKSQHARRRALRPAHRRAGRHPAAGRQGRPAAALELGLAARSSARTSHTRLYIAAQRVFRIATTAATRGRRSAAT